LAYQRKPEGFWILLMALAVAAPLVWCAQASAQEDWTKRDAWQRPDEVLDALKLKAGSVVADVGAGPGYFTFHLAERVGAQGKVYAVDIDSDVLAKIRSRAEKEKLKQIETVLGAADDPKLPAEQFNAILVMNAYHEFVEYDEMLKGILRALRPGGLLAIIDAEDKLGEDRKTYQGRHRIPKEMTREDAERNGFRFVKELPGFTNPARGRTYYFLLFEKE
jgi:ubiquinone/menaquinone biosynthesis C-methylase UbiE